MDSRYIDDKKSLNDSLKQKGFVSFILSSLRVVYRNYIKRYFEFADLLANSLGIFFSYLIFVLYPLKKKHT